MNMGNLLLNVLPSWDTTEWAIGIIVTSALLTLLIESALTLFFSPRKKFVTVVALLNLVSNPMMNLVLFITHLGSVTGVSVFAVVLLQVIVVGVETAVIKRWMDFSWGKSFLLSLFLNASSFFFGGALLWLAVPW